MIKLVRGHIDRSMNSTNYLIFGAYYPNTMYLERVRRNGFIPPEAFIGLDMNGLIQDEFGVPLIFHVRR
ncbi:hypothetical protein, partial [Nocardia blacklockiae]|uniref:hypothetical protein n=1 Tax=Nocardia blacklockiae TaxID=480036 RepID=UPI001E60E883